MKLNVIVQFGEDVPVESQGPALLEMEKSLRKATGLDIRVIKNLKGDDSKLRIMMTPAQRAKL